MLKVCIFPTGKCISFLSKINNEVRQQCNAGCRWKCIWSLVTENIIYYYIFIFLINSWILKLSKTSHLIMRLRRERQTKLNNTIPS